MDGKTCGNCRWWEPYSDNLGECTERFHRMGLLPFVDTLSEDTCGEHQPKENTNATE